jgi:hypothetical protein
MQRVQVASCSAPGAATFAAPRAAARGAAPRRRSHVARAGARSRTLTAKRPRRTPPSTARLTRRPPHAAEPPAFDESKANVRRLLNRDRSTADYKELDRSFAAGDGGASPASAREADAAQRPAAPSASAPAATAPAFSPPPAAPFGSPAAPPSFGASSAASVTTDPFGVRGGAAGRSPFSPNGGSTVAPTPYPADDTPWFKQITLTQVVIALSFVFVIALMIATFFVVLKMGAIRLNDV